MDSGGVDGRTMAEPWLAVLVVEVMMVETLVMVLWLEEDEREEMELVDKFKQRRGGAVGGGGGQVQ